jgi:hypothetical protein
MTRQDSIRARGLAAHLDETKDRHNGRGYADFLKYVISGDEFGQKIPVLKLSRIFNTSRPTMEKWLMIYNEEKANNGTN